MNARRMKFILCVVLALGFALTISSPTSLHAKDKDKDSGKSDSKQSDSNKKSDNQTKGNDSKGEDSRGNDSRGNDRDHVPFYVYPNHHNYKDFGKLKGKLQLKIIKAVKNFENQKIIVCHKGHAISISRAALHAHLGHGDTIGRCDVTPTKNQ